HAPLGVRATRSGAAYATALRRSGEEDEALETGELQPVFFCAAIHASMRRSSTSRGSDPWRRTASWNARTSKRDPSAFSARVRSSGIFRCPTLWAGAGPGYGG